MGLEKAQAVKVNTQQQKLQSKFANQSHLYWSAMRNNLNMAHRSENIDEITISSLKSELLHILDSGILTYPNTLQQIGIEPEMDLKERKQAFGLEAIVEERSPIEQLFIKNLAHKADQSRKANWAWRIAQEAVEKHKEGWYPFFVTLTVDPIKADPETLWKEGKEFRTYIRNLANIVCKVLGHKRSNHPPYRPESDYITYVGVIEHGKSREHHHGHFLIWLKEIPKSWKICPNQGIRNPASKTHNECLAMRTIWKWSRYDLSPALYFRTIQDIWEIKHKFILPMKDGKPMKTSVPETAGAYITKYLTKEHKQWHHRMKATRNLGLKKLKKTIEGLQTPTVEALTWRAAKSALNLSLMKIHSAPLGLIRSLAKQQHFLIKFREKRLDLTELLTSNSAIFTKMLQSVRSGARPDRMDSLQFFDWVGQLLPEQKGYSKYRLIAAHVAIGIEFPPEKKVKKHIKIGANDIGHT